MNCKNCGHRIRSRFLICIGKDEYEHAASYNLNNNQCAAIDYDKHQKPKHCTCQKAEKVD